MLENREFVRNETSSAPKISVILTSFNHAKYICEAIESVLNQTFTDFELIILDDRSSDNSWDLINRYTDPRIKAFRSERSGEVAGQVNKAISEVALGEYIAIHHSDDVWEINKLQDQVRFLEASPNIGAVFSNALAIDERSVPLADPTHFYYDIFDQPNRTRHEWLRFFFSSGNALCHSSVLIRKRCYEDCGPYSDVLAQVPDMDMWIRLCLKYEIHVLPEKLVRFRVRDNEANTSGSRPDSRIRSAYELYKIIPNYLKLASFDDLVKVFPSAQQYYQADETDLGFVFAMVALEGEPSPFTQLLCQDILFEAISDPKRAAIIKRLYGFDYKTFIELTGKHDVFSLEKYRDFRNSLAERDGQVASLNHSVAERDGQIAGLIDSITEIHSSTSWRVTAPIRFLSSTMRKVRSLASALPGILNQGGGFWPTLLIALKILRREGLVGIRIRVRHFFARQANQASNVSLEPLRASKLSIVPYYIDPRLDSDAPASVGATSIAVHLHLYGTEMLDGFTANLNNIPVEYDLYVSVSNHADAKRILTELQGLLPGAKNIFVEPVPNRGRDIAPMIIQFGERLARYEIIAHIHNEKDPHNASPDGTQQDLLAKLMGAAKTSGGRIAHIVGLLQTTAKIVYAEERIGTINDRSGWADNHELAGYVLEKYTRLSMKDFPVVEFPNGSMFWARSACLKDFLGLPLTYSDFPSEPIAAAGTLAQALERLILVFASEYEGQCIRIHEGDSIKDYRQYEQQKDYSKSIIHSDTKVLSYYLPQFHPIPENDRWHGKGFTEWTKVSAANPLFEGHYQQHIPHSDIGYYLLDSPETFMRQAEQMRKSGVYGQIFYHYWFTGKLILEQPAQVLLNTPDVQMPFCFCWANENWTRRWDGNEKEILLGQSYSAQDARDFIRYLIPFFKDKRYIMVEDRPVLFIYRPSSIPNTQEYLDIWERECANAGVRRPYVVAVLTRGAMDPKDFGMDAGAERVLHDWTDGAAPEIKNSLTRYWPMNGSVLSYADVSSFYMGQTEEKDFTYFRSTVPIWDNTARYGSEALLLHGSTPQLFQKWMESSISYSQSTLPADRRFVLVNAWNEWAEGAHLEPDSRYGYSYLNAVGRALSGISYSEELNSSCSIHSGTKVHLSISELVLNQLQKDSVLKQRFVHCLSNSSIFNTCAVSINTPDLLKGSTASVEGEPNNADFVLEFRKVAYFDPMAIEKMLQTACASGSAVIANSYGGESVADVTANGSVEAFEAHSAPMLLSPAEALKSRYKNFRLRTDARCFLASPSLRTNGEKPVVTTIIRFHKSGNLNDLRNALFCLYAMNDCVVAPLIAAQDLNNLQSEALENTLSGFVWPQGYEPQVHHYKSQDGRGDLRSKMLNESLKQVKTRYAAFLDYDDLLMPYAYSWLLERLQDTGKAVSFGRVYFTSFDSARGLILERKRIFECGYSYSDFVGCNHAPLHSFMLDMERLDLSPVIYYEDQRYMEDYLLTLHLFTEENADWDSLKNNFYIGDYIHSVDRAHTLALTESKKRQALLSDPEYMVCEMRIREMRKKVAQNRPKSEKPR